MISRTLTQVRLALAQTSRVAQSSGRNFSAARTLRVPQASPPKPKSPSTLKDIADEGEMESVVPLPILPRPLGLLRPPTAEPKTWEQQKEEMLDRDRHLEKRRVLVKQATSGYFEDYHKAMRNGHGGKTWLAPKVLIREDKALYFPDIAGKNLLGDHVHTTTMCKDNISIVAFMSTQVAEEHVKSFAERVVEQYISAQDFRYVVINLQENILKSALVSLSKRSIAASIPQKLHATYTHSSQNIEMLREPIGFENKHLGYVYLLDENLKIRWAGCGYAKDEERAALMTCTRLLLERRRKAGVEARS